MILKIGPLPKIPYVDGVPVDASTQSRIGWIINGETLFGAKEKTGNDGELNRAGVAIQRNAVQLEFNSLLTVDKVNEVIEQVNLISDNLGSIADQHVADTLNKAVADIALLKTDSSTQAGSIDSLVTRVAATELAIGTRDPEKDPKGRTLRNDIIFIKGELGNYAGFDVNGDPVVGAEGTGMKYKIMQNANAVSLHETRITKLEDDWVNSDVGQITDEVARLRTEIGPRGQATLDSVYVRLNKQTNSLQATNEEITLINAYIGRSGSGSAGSITLRMASAEDSIKALQNTVDTPVTGLVSRMNTVEGSLGTDSTVPGSIRYDIADVKRSVVDINMILGESSDDGLRGDVVEALSAIGSNSDSTSIKGRLVTLENTSRDTRAVLSDVTSVVGDANSGLVAANIVLGKEIYGNAEGSDQFEKDGIKKSLQDVIAQIGGGSTGLSQLITALTQRVSDLETKVAAQEKSINLLNELQVK